MHQCRNFAVLKQSVLASQWQSKMSLTLVILHVLWSSNLRRGQELGDPAKAENPSGRLNRRRRASSLTGWPEDLKQNAHFFQKVVQTVFKLKKCQNIYNKAQLERPKHLHQTTFEPLKYLQQSMTWNRLFGWNLLKQKVVQYFAIFWGYFIFSKNPNESPKVALFGGK